MIARKRFGQHFLEPAWVVKVVDAVAPAPGDSFVEIGPGRGALTRPLAARAARVTAFEIDRDLAATLRQTAPSNLTIMEGDFLESGSLESAGGPIRVAGNLPYNVASPILFKLIELYDAGVPLTDATLMLQREVADRLLASPRSKEYGVLTLLVGLSADVQRLLSLPPGAFRPMPKVQSSLVRLSFHPPAPRPRERSVFVALVRTAFMHRRKTIENAVLSHWPGSRASLEIVLASVGLDRQRRPESLDLAEFVRLSDALGQLPTVG